MRSVANKATIDTTGTATNATNKCYFKRKIVKAIIEAHPSPNKIHLKKVFLSLKIFSSYSN